MSVVEFTSKKGSGKKVSTNAAKVAADPDWEEPEEDDDEAPKGKRKRQQMDEDSQEAIPPKKTARGRPAKGSKSKDRAEGASAAATGESSGANEAEGGGSANEDEAEPARPTKSRKAGKAGKAGKAAASSAGAKADGAGAAPATSSRKQSKRAAKQAEEEEESFDSDEYEEEDNGRRSAGGRGGGGEADEAPGRKGEASASTAGRRKFARRFQKDLPQMLYGFGDVRTPLPQTVQLMEDLVVDYVTQVSKLGSWRLGSKLVSRRPRDAGAAQGERRRGGAAARDARQQHVARQGAGLALRPAQGSEAAAPRARAAGGLRGAEAGARHRESRRHGKVVR